jgi:HK97 family phage portal protein
MGWLQKLQNKAINKVFYWANSVNGTPSFSQFGNNIMNDETVFTITNRILDEYSKMNPRHIRIVKGKQVDVTNNNLNEILKNPNNLMTQSDFLRKCAWLRETYKNCFIYPTYDLYYNPTNGRTKKVYKALYPLQPAQVDFYEDDLGIIYVDFTFMNGEHSGKIRYDEVIHWRKEFGENEYMGGDINGTANNTALLKHLQENDKLLQATFKSIEGSLRINGILKLNGYINKENGEKERKEFEKKLETNQSGILSLDNGGEYTPIPYYGKNVSKDILKFFDDKIRRHYGVSEAILDGDYTAEQKEAFYETVLESGAISLGQALERVLLTPFERSNGNTIICYTSEIQMMSAQNKIKIAELLLPVGGVNTNTILSWFGEPPVEGGDEYYMSLNWVKKSIADEYQLSKYNDNASYSQQNNENIVKNENNT